jgi:RNA polymerase sigma factor (sigma-70 family)
MQQISLNSRKDDAMTTPDIDQLFRVHGPQLRRVVGSDVRASRATIEDACQVAWVRLIDQRHRVRGESALAWLTTTAVREALLQVADAGRRDSLEAMAGDSGESIGLPPDTRFAEGADARDRLRALNSLPLRQRRLMWLQGLGLSYAEMAEHERCTRRTVERQLLRAKHLVAA